MSRKYEEIRQGNNEDFRSVRRPFFGETPAPLNELGFDAKKPKGSFYCYVRAPKGTEKGVEFKSAADCSDFLIRKALISTVPWDEAGKYLRFSVTFESDSIQEEIKVINELKRRIEKLKLIF